MPFNRVYGQALAKSLLGRIVRSGRAAHAYMFCGPDGIGKSIAAREFIMALKCPDGRRLGEACGVCAVCERIEAGNHPDVMTVEPEGQSIKIDQARAALRHISLTPLEAGVKAVLIRRADLMTDEAANCLLKGLEEPPGPCLFVLTSPSTAAVLPTVASRCQVVPFAACSLEEVEAYLAAGHPGDAARARAAAFWSGGIPGRGDLFFDPAFLKVRGAAFKAVRDLRDLDIVEFSSEIGRDEAPLFVDCVESLVRDMLVLGSGAPETLLCNPDLAADLSPLLGAWTPERARRACAQVARTRAALGANASARLAIEVMMLALQSNARDGYN